MPPNFQGFEDFSAAVTGGSAIEGQAFNAALARLTIERSRMADLEKKLANARVANLEAEAQSSFAGGNSSQENIVLGGLGTDFAASERGFGTQRQNVAGNEALDMVLGMIGSGELQGMDAVQALTGQAGNKLMSANNLGITERAESAAQIAESRASLEASKLEDKFPKELDLLDAKIAKTNRGTTGSGGKVTPIPSGTVLAQLFPFVDGKQPGLQEFFNWKAQQSQVDEKYKDFWFAHDKWLLKQPAQGITTGVDEATTAITGDEGAVVPEQVSTEPVTPESEAQKLVALADQFIANGKDPDAVREALEKELAKMGFQLSGGQ